MKNIQLPLRAKHFKAKTFTDNCNCGIANSAKEMFNTQSVTELINQVFVNDQSYRHDWYGHVDYWDDYKKAASHNFDETIIRTITLTPCN